MCTKSHYYLVVAGYSDYGGCLVPYCGICYHLPTRNSCSGGRRRATGPKELFNHSHWQLRNCIERCFGLLKSRFSLLRWGMPSYTISHQTDLVLARCILHNFVRRFDVDNPLFEGMYPHYEDDELIFSY